MLLPQLFTIVDSRARIAYPGLIVVPEVSLLEESTIDLAEIELVLGCLNVQLLLLRSVESWSDLVEAAACVRGCCKFPCRYARRNRVRDNGVIGMLR